MLRNLPTIIPQIYFRHELNSHIISFGKGIIAQWCTYSYLILFQNLAFLCDENVSVAIDTLYQYKVKCCSFKIQILLTPWGRPNVQKYGSLKQWHKLSETNLHTNSYFIHSLCCRLDLLILEPVQSILGNVYW